MNLLPIILIVCIIHIIIRKGNVEDKYKSEIEIPSYEDSIIYIIAYTMLADGKVTKNELSAVKSFLLRMLGEEDAKMALLTLRDYLKQIDMTDAQDIRLCCLRLNQEMTYQERVSLLSTLFQISIADDMISDEEAEIIQKYARFTCIRPSDFIHMQNYYTYGYTWHKDQDNRSKYKQRQNSENETNNQPFSQKESNKSWAYKTLGLPNNASEKEIKNAYRKLAQKYHPDKQIGASEETIKEATEKFKEITLAYETLTKGED